MNPPRTPDDPAVHPGSPSRGRRRALRVLGWGLFVCCATLGLMEAALRWTSLGPSVYTPRRFEPRGVPFTEARSGSIAFPVYQPGVEFASVYDAAGDFRGYLGAGGKVVYHINPHGFRGAEVPVRRTSGCQRILCLGDSLTFGEGVHDSDTYPALLGKLLRSRRGGGCVEVINAGVQGYGTREEVSLFLLRGLAFQPDVVTLGFFLNDVMPYPETIAQNDAATTGYARSKMASISRLWEALERRAHAARSQQALFDGIRQGFRSETWAVDRELIRALQEETRRVRCRFIVVILPVLWDLDGDYPFADQHAEVAAACRTAGCECVDMLDVLRGRDAASLWVHPTDQHPNEIAQRLIAERLAEVIDGPAAAPR